MLFSCFMKEMSMLYYSFTWKGWFSGGGGGGGIAENSNRMVRQFLLNRLIGFKAGDINASGDWGWDFRKCVPQAMSLLQDNPSWCAGISVCPSTVPRGDTAEDFNDAGYSYSYYTGSRKVKPLCRSSLRNDTLGWHGRRYQCSIAERNVQCW